MAFFFLQTLESWLIHTRKNSILLAFADIQSCYSFICTTSLLAKIDLCHIVSPIIDLLSVNGRHNNPHISKQKINFDLKWRIKFHLRFCVWFRLVFQEGGSDVQLIILGRYVEWGVSILTRRKQNETSGRKSKKTTFTCASICSLCEINRAQHNICEQNILQCFKKNPSPCCWDELPVELRDLLVGSETSAKHSKTHLFRVVVFSDVARTFEFVWHFVVCVIMCKNNNNTESNWRWR